MTHKVEAIRKYMSGELSTDYKEIVPPNVAKHLREAAWDEPRIDPNEILFSILDHVHDGNREELVGQLILMLGWFHLCGLSQMTNRKELS